MKISTLTGAWRRLVLMTVVAVLAGLLSSVSASPATAAAPEAPPAAKSTTAPAYGQMKRVCPHSGDPSDFPQCRQTYYAPTTMKAKFKRGDYRNAGGVRLPSWVYNAAKAFYQRNPSHLPKSARPTGPGSARKGIDWGFLDWTKKALNTTRCVGYAYTPIGWYGCKDIPDWADATRQVSMRCGGTVLIAGFSTRSGVAAGAAGATCLWNLFSD